MPLPIRNSRIKLSQGQIFWREIGRGPALIFLHGSWEDSSQWLPVIEQLHSEFHCFAPDLLGFGESECPNAHYSIELEVECLAEYVEALKLRQVYLVGHSLGGWIAASYALKYMDQVRGIVLLSPEGVVARGLERRWQGAKLLLQPAVFAMLRSLLPLNRFLKLQSIRRLLQRRQTLLESPISCKLLFRRRRSELKAEFLGERLKWLKLPVLVLQGERDESDGAILSHTYAQLAPQATLLTIPRAKKDILQSHSTAIAQQIREFTVTSAAKS